MTPRQASDARFRSKFSDDEWRSYRREIKARYREKLLRDPVRLSREKDATRRRNQSFRKSHPERLRHYDRKKHYGITEEQFAALALAQNGRCAICRVLPKKTLHVDHCHATGVVRGLLCHNCNAMLGQARDSVERLRLGALYLERNTRDEEPAH